ncbi:MAG TPA: response regulator [Deltaproteobacteria bacterium]|nr:response regulator [Deltaproteobacteria bacterium]
MKTIRIRDEEIIMGNENILLVDDEDAVLEVNREILKTLGYQVIAAGSGSEAIELFRDGKGIDLVLLDMIMPGMSGADTFDVLKSINPSIKVILLTGYSLDGQAARILENGCNGFIQKPFRISNLSHMIRKVLNNG